MPSTDQMIADLVAKGFKLPEGLGCQNGYWALGHDPDDPAEGVSGDQFQQQAYDLIACEFARQVEAQPERDRVRLGFFWDEWQLAMRTGDSAAAIKALWEGL